MGNHKNQRFLGLQKSTISARIEKMKVYVVIGNYHYEDSNVLGVYNSEELAKRKTQERYNKENKNKLILEWENRNENYPQVICADNLDNDSLDYDGFRIEIFEVIK